MLNVTNTINRILFSTPTTYDMDRLVRYIPRMDAIQLEEYKILAYEYGMDAIVIKIQRENMRRNPIQHNTDTTHWY